MRSIFMFILLLLCCTNCASTQQKMNDCEESIIHAQECINNYYFTDESAYLDSALIYLEGPSNKCGNLQLSFELNRATVYFLKNDFGKAIDAYQAVDHRMFSFPEYKHIIINQIKAKEAITKDDAGMASKYYVDIVNGMDSYLHRNVAARDSILRLSDHALLTPAELEIATIFESSYFYKSKIHDIKVINAELDSLQKRIQGDSLYFEILKKSIAGVDGYHMSVPFE